MKRKRLLASIVFEMPKKLISIVPLFLLIQPAYAESLKEEAKSKKIEKALAEAVALQCAGRRGGTAAFWKHGLEAARAEILKMDAKPWKCINTNQNHQYLDFYSLS